MQRVHDHYVVHRDDPVAWEFTMWLGLTDKGKTHAKTQRSQDNRRWPQTVEEPPDFLRI